MSRAAIALVPARRASVRVPSKNTRPFFGEFSLLQLKILALRRCSLVTRIVVSSDDEVALGQASGLGAEARLRDPRLCGEYVELRELFETVLEDFREAVVYWAHPTSPFVLPGTIDRAIEGVLQDNDRCILGVQRCQDFTWSSPEAPNYDPGRQPRSQDLPPQWRVTGGIHVATGLNFIRYGRLAFKPMSFLELSYPEALDIDTGDGWLFCRRIAPVFATDVLGMPGQ